MKRFSKATNILLILLCVVLVAALGGLVVWNRQQTGRERQKLEKLAEESRETDKKALKEAEKKEKEIEKEVQEKVQSEEEAKISVTPTPAEKEVKAEPEGISFWGDDLLTQDDTEKYSYMAVLQKILKENGYSIPVYNKTLQGGGTLSMMKRAGVEDSVLQDYISRHQQGANGAALPVTETGIRDFTEEELVRDDVNSVPIIFMGYYGGWNHDPNELAQQQEHILKTFENQEQFIVVGTRPLDGSVDSATLDTALKEKWGEHYISLAEVTPQPSSTYEAQEAMAQAVFNKMTELNYIRK